MSWHRSVPAPALVVHPPDAASLDEAQAAIEQWEFYSRKTLDSAQRLAVELMMAETADGRWAARTTGRPMSRQNGKGDELEVVEAWGLIQRGEAIVHTAHEIPTAKSAHERLVAHFESHRDLRRRVRQVTYGNGNQQIIMSGDSGGIIVYRTRTSGGGRGLDDISRLVVDEAQHVQPEQLASSLPILAVNPNPQTNFCGSAGIADRSDWWWQLRKRAIVAAANGDGGSFSWLEHSAEQVSLSRDGRIISTPPEVEDRDAWRRANPALGVRIPESELEEELHTLGPALFAREHLCVWDPYPGDEGGFLPFEQWQDLVVEAPKSMTSVSYGLAVGPDGASAFFASAGRLPTGRLYVDIIHDPRAGTDWVVDHAVDLFRRKKVPIRVNPSAPEGAFVRPLEEAGVEVVQVSARDYQQACGEVLDAIKNGTIHHLDQPFFDRAVRAVQRRDVGKEGAWVWAEPVSGVDITTVKAATLALTGVTAKRRPRIHTLKEG